MAIRQVKWAYSNYSKATDGRGGGEGLRARGWLYLYGESS